MNDPTFIGPVARERKPDLANPGHFVIAYVVGVVQGSSMVALGAPTREAAAILRAEYVEAGAEPVPTSKLLHAIASALKVAAEPAVPGARRAA